MNYSEVEVDTDFGGMNVRAVERDCVMIDTGSKFRLEIGSSVYTLTARVTKNPTTGKFDTLEYFNLGRCWLRSKNPRNAPAKTHKRKVRELVLQLADEYVEQNPEALDIIGNDRAQWDIEQIEKEIAETEVKLDELHMKLCEAQERLVA